MLVSGIFTISTGGISEPSTAVSAPSVGFHHQGSSWASLSWSPVWRNLSIAWRCHHFLTQSGRIGIELKTVDLYFMYIYIHISYPVFFLDVQFHMIYNHIYHIESVKSWMIMEVFAWRFEVVWNELYLHCWHCSIFLPCINYCRSTFL